MNKINGLKFIGGSFLLLGVSFNIFSFNVDGGHRALMFDAITGKGIREKVLDEGIHFKFPLLYEPIIFEIRLKPKIIESKTPARDMQLVDITVRILEKPDVNFLKKLYLEQRQDYAEKVLPNITHDTIKTIVSKYNPEELITEREKVSYEIRQALVTKALEFNIIIVDVSILHVEFSKEFRHAIENKQVSQQNAERAKFIVLKQEQEKKITIIKAEAESESAMLFNEAISKYGSAFLELKKLEVSKEIIDNVSQNSNISFIPYGTGNTNFLYKI